MNELIFGACRFKFCSSVNICCSWELTWSCGGPSFNCFSGYGINAPTASFTFSRSYFVSSARFFIYFFCRTFSSFFRPFKVYIWSITFLINNYTQKLHFLILISNSFSCPGLDLSLTFFQKQPLLDLWLVLLLLSLCSN